MKIIYNIVSIKENIVYYYTNVSRPGSRFRMTHYIASEIMKQKDDKFKLKI